MGWATTEMTMRGAAAGLFLLLAFLFLRDWKLSLSARLGAWLSIGGAAYVMLMAIDLGGAWTWPRVPLHLLSLSTPPAFWLFAASWFDDDFELRARHWMFVLIVVLAGVVSNYLFWSGQLGGVTPFILWRIGSIIAIALGLHAALIGRANDLVEARRRMRLLISIVVAAAILWIIISEVAIRRWPPPVEWRLANVGAMLLLALAVSFSILGWRDPALLAPPVKPKPETARPEADDSALLARLDAEMRHERLYRQDGLTITTVAARLGVPEYRLRRAINQGLGARNFNAYLNGFRIAEAREALADPAQREVPILTIAIDAGFGSLAPFNRAFRDLEGCTPTEFRARALAA